MLGFGKRARFLGIDFGPGIFDNDSVAEPIISPEIYRDIIQPIENELSEREGGIECWHNCGNTDRMMEWIRTLPYCKLWHISPWSDCKIAAEMYSREQAL